MNVFISYSQKDKGIVEDILKELSSLNIRIFSDTNITAGENWIQRIKEEIEQADLYLFFMSNNVNQSQSISSEISFAIIEKHNKSHKIILPILIEQIKELPFFISDFQYLDLSKKDLYAQNIDKLKNIISEYEKELSLYLSKGHDDGGFYQSKGNIDQEMISKAEYLNYARKQLENEIKQQEEKRKKSILSLNAVIITVFVTAFVSSGLSIFSLYNVFKEKIYYILFFLLGVLVTSFSSFLYFHYIKTKVDKHKNGVEL